MISLIYAPSAVKVVSNGPNLKTDNNNQAKNKMLPLSILHLGIPKHISRDNYFSMRSYLLTPTNNVDAELKFFVP